MLHNYLIDQEITANTTTLQSYLATRASYKFIIPAQLNPSPENPAPQLQVKEPSVLKQMPPAGAQGDMAHSSISEVRK